ncbi:MAG TPA: plastocyanin/azurin family copper-binding protein [Nitrososphaeraceae archaeon]|jgi:plastocyanin
MKISYTIFALGISPIFIALLLLPLETNLNVRNVIDSYTFIATHHTAFAAQVVKVSIVLGASTLGDKAFSPNPVSVKKGDTVMWTNNDNQFHTVVSGSPSSTGGAAVGKVFDSGLSGPNALTMKGKTFSHTFNEKGVFPYFCQLHPTMIGKVIVT